ncbi:integrase core domain protein [Vespula squamosa]|uniref:Integrase core domain protein n=1 Tax=Vespula squamosa TaxID=30214 RepID=A0ABD2BSI0_VESSQ
MRIYNVETPFKQVQMDNSDPLSKFSRGNRFLLVIVDCYIKWVEAFPFRNFRAKTVAKMVVEQIVSRHGIPEIYVDAFFDCELESNNDSETDNDVSVGFKQKNVRIRRSNENSDSSDNRDESFTSTWTRHDPERKLEALLETGIKRRILKRGIFRPWFFFWAKRVYTIGEYQSSNWIAPW